MENQVKTIRLIYPQWQGGKISHWISEIKDPELSSRGYYLGAQLLSFLAPDSGQKTCTVPVSTDLVERKVTDGVMDRDALVAQTKAAMDILKVEKPDKIVTLGGECSTSVVPFTYLADKYKNDVTIIPREYFNPPILKHGLQIKKTKNTIGVHYCWGSWRSGSFLKRIYVFSKRKIQAIL